MAKFKVHAGDFDTDTGSVISNGVILKTDKYPEGEHFYFKRIVELEVASEESVRKIGGTVGWAAVGGVVLGPAGLLAGLLLGGKKKEVTFVAKFDDGRKLLATADSKSFTKLQAATF